MAAEAEDLRRVIRPVARHKVLWLHHYVRTRPEIHVRVVLILVNELGGVAIGPHEARVRRQARHVAGLENDALAGRIFVAHALALVHGRVRDSRDRRQWGATMAIVGVLSGESCVRDHLILDRQGVCGDGGESDHDRCAKRHCRLSEWSGGDEA